MSLSGRLRWVAETFYGDDWDGNLSPTGSPTSRSSEDEWKLILEAEEAFGKLDEEGRDTTF